MPTLQTPRVQVDVQAWTPQGAYYHADLMGDLMTITTAKSTDEPYGTFQLTFTLREDAAGSWADKLPFRTYVEIRAGVGTTGPPPILMRGLVDTGAQTLTMPAPPTGPDRQVVISGRDLGAILNDWQILYLWGIDPMSTYLAANLPNGGDALSATLGLSVGQTDPNTLLEAFLRKLVNGQAVAGMRQYVPVPDLVPTLTIPSAYQINFVNLQPWQGSYANFLDYFSAPPWGEWFVLDTEAAPCLVVRQTPYKTYASGRYPLPYGGTPESLGFYADVPVAGGAVTAHDLTINGAAAVYTYYSTTPDLASALGQSYAQFFYVSQHPLSYIEQGQVAQTTQVTVTTGSTAHGVQEQTSPRQARQPGSNPYFDQARAALWGIQPLQLTTPWVSTLQQTFGQAAQEQVAALNTWLVNVYQDNERFVTGTITVHGAADYRIGRYLVVEPGSITADPDPWEAYMQQVTHTIDLSSDQATWTTDLGVVRGRVRTT
jgi:hypothetical protein